MGYLLRVRLSSFVAGAATASVAGLYLLQKDFNVFHRSFSQQIKEINESNERRISALEKLKELEASKPAKATERRSIVAT